MNEAPLRKNPELGSDRTPGSNRNSNGGRRAQTPFDAPRKNYWKTFWKSVGVFALISGIGVFGWLQFTHAGRETAKTINQGAAAVWQAKTNPGLIFTHAGSDVVNILLIGRDVNYKIGRVYDPKTKTYRPYQVYDEDAPARSDTMIVVSLDRTRNVIHMVSLPRDARVHMPPNKFEVRRAKLNAAHAYGGPDLLKQAIHDELGLTIHHHAVIRFEGFKKLIDQVGGVEVDVIGALQRNGKRGPLKYDDNWGNLHINLKPGKQILDGQQAHNYVRFRMDLEGDPGRIKRQQQVMRALAKSLMHQPIYKIAPIVQEVRKQFKTSMTDAEIASAADFTKGIGDPSKIQPLTLFGIYGHKGSLILNKPKNAQLFRYLFGPTFDETRFLENSPSTERDEMGEESNSSPGAKAILRKAGLIKGAAPAPEMHAGNAAVSSTAISAPVESESTSRLAVADDSSSSYASQAPIVTEEPRRRRRVRRERAESSSESTPAEAPRSRIELSVPEDEIRTEDSTPARSTDESPVPQPEESSSTESPIPRAE